jgi:cyclopropane fatty-acyl-phospholipid synthase-like methyltransferase
MGYFDNDKNVQDYIEMVEGYDGAELINALEDYLPKGSTLLELGMGPGKDLDILKETYVATGSDSSQIFVDRYNNSNKDADVILLNAVTIDTEIKFDCIYSNKVLHHLKKVDLIKSFRRQKDVLNDGGILFHSFWYGNKEEEHHGLLFVYYLEDQLIEIVKDDFEILEMKKYSEMETDDSIYIVLKKR